MKKIVEFFAGKPCPVSGNRRQRRQGKMPPVHVLLRKKRKLLVLHQQHKRGVQRHAGKSGDRGQRVRRILCLDPPARKGRF